MVHTWVSLRNDRIGTPCDNRRVLRIFHGENAAHFYGDYDLDIFMGTKHDYKSLDAVIAKTTAKSGGWIHCVSPEDGTDSTAYSSLFDIMNEFASASQSQKRKLFPWRETGDLVRVRRMRDDGNFKMYACETQRFYYVLCFATS
jgi:hypothetical protein